MKNNLHFSKRESFEHLHIQNGILNISSNRDFYAIFYPTPNNRNGYINIINITLKSTAKDECVLIWYNNYPSDEMYDNIKMLYEIGCPDEVFLWPIEVTELYEESYGYIVRKMDNSLQSFGDILSGKAIFDTDKARVECSISLITAFIKLYEKNLCYFVFSPDMLWVDCATGKIILTACEMITSEGEQL